MSKLGKPQSQGAGRVIDSHLLSRLILEADAAIAYIGAIVITTELFT